MSLSYYIRNTKTDSSFDLNENKFFANSWTPVTNSDKEQLENMIASDSELFKDCEVAYTGEPETFDIQFNDEENSNSKGFSLSLEAAKQYIADNNGTDNSYFVDYKGGIVSIVSNETEDVVFETKVK